MYIEPCCISHQLPRLLREHPSCFFQSNGDWAIEKLMTAVACMASGHDIILSVPEVDIDLCRVFLHWFNRGWLQHLQLLTKYNQSDMLRQELKGYLSNIDYAYDDRISNSLICFQGSPDSVVVQGDILLHPDNHIHFYSAYYGGDRAIIETATKPIVSMINVKSKTRNIETS